MLIKNELKTHIQSSDSDEIARFDALAEEWWKEDGAFKTVHAFNKTRTEYFAQHLPQLFARDPHAPKPLDGLTVLDAGCGAGLVAEAVHDLGATVCGIDAAERNILIAERHAAEFGKGISYRHILPEALVQEGDQFDLVLTLEVVEHVADVDLFLGSCAQLVKPGGAMVVGTLNRTFLSFVKAIIGAEYLLGWLPKGTHNWRKFVTPQELESVLGRYALVPNTLRGVELSPVRRTWSVSKRFDTTYLMSFDKKA